eukprot:3239878-Alexandrium_andersonii.AAC.1
MRRKHRTASALLSNRHGVAVGRGRRGQCRPTPRRRPQRRQGPSMERARRTCWARLTMPPCSQ